MSFLFFPLLLPPTQADDCFLIGVVKFRWRFENMYGDLLKFEMEGNVTRDMK